jgi:Ca-activated chloride channel family protein
MYELEHPWFLLLGLLPLIIYKFFPRVPVDYKMALKVPFFYRFDQFEAKKLQVSPCMWFWHWVVIWNLLVFGLAGPRWVGPPQTVMEATRNIMLVLDISGSMSLQDMENNGHLTTRWSVVKRTALDFVKKRAEDKMGVILFGERAYLFTPLTHDQKTLYQQIDDASVGLAGQATALGDAMMLATSHLKVTPLKGRIMILLTDGVANAGVISPLKAAKYAIDNGIKIYSIGLGPTSNNKSLPALFWQMQHASDLDEESLKKIAAMTKGQYFRATDAKSLNEIYHTIERLEPVKQIRKNTQLEKQYFYIPSAIAWGWIMILFMVQMFKDRRQN